MVFFTPTSSSTIALQEVESLLSSLRLLRSLFVTLSYIRLRLLSKFLGFLSLMLVMEGFVAFSFCLFEIFSALDLFPPMTANLI